VGRNLPFLITLAFMTEAVTIGTLCRLLESTANIFVDQRDI